VTASNQLTAWQCWIRQPQKIWLRRVLFQVHLWSGIAVGLYILMIAVTGSVLVYRNELYRAATPQPIISKGPGPRLSDDQLTQAAMRLYSGYRVVSLTRARNLDQAVDVWLRRGHEIKRRLFDPRSGSDLGESVPTGIRLVSKLMDLHDNLFAGETGRKVNGVGALAVLALAVTGVVIWWPGIKTWRRSLIVHRNVGTAQYDRLLEPRFHVSVCSKRGLSQYSRPASGPRRPPRTSHYRQCRGAHRRSDNLLARHLALRPH